ncbi:MAG: hypothetical protein ABI472_23915 [Ginsengibacter sp.]
MKRLLFLSIVFPGLLLSCSNNDSNPVTAEKENYAKTKKILQEKEEKNPQNFLWVEGHDKRNILGQTVIKGTITNKATVAVFKDVDLKLSFYSKTRTLLETDKETVFEVLHPGESKNFKTKYFAPKGTDSVAFAVIQAKIATQ